MPPCRPLGVRVATLAREAAASGFDDAGWDEFRRLGQELCERMLAHVQKEEMALLPLLEENMDSETEMRLYEEYVGDRVRYPMPTIPTGPDRGTRRLDAEDVERVIAIDRAHSGHSRRSFFEKRFAAASAHPDEFIHIGVTRGGSLRGFAMARLLRGEFGKERAVAVLDGLGVEAESQERGIGQALMNELTTLMRRMGVRSLQSQAVWTNHDLLRFFDAVGFQARSEPRSGTLGRRAAGRGERGRMTSMESHNGRTRQDDNSRAGRAPPRRSTTETRRHPTSVRSRATGFRYAQ